MGRGSGGKNPATPCPRSRAVDTVTVINDDKKFVVPMSGCSDLPMSRSVDSPSVDRAAVQKLFWCHDAVALEDQPVLHHECHVAQGFDVFQGIPFYGDHIGGQAGSDRPAPVGDITDLVSVGGHDLQNLFVGNS